MEPWWLVAGVLAGAGATVVGVCLGAVLVWRALGQTEPLLRRPKPQEIAGDTQ